MALLVPESRPGESSPHARRRRPREDGPSALRVRECGVYCTCDPKILGQQSSEDVRDASIEAILPSGSTDAVAYTAIRRSLQESCAS